MDDSMTKSRFLDTVRADHARWQAALYRIDPALMTEPGICGPWAVKDLVAHVTWHEREMVGIIQARALVGSDLWGLPTDERNAAIYAQNRERALDDVLAESRAVGAALLANVETLSDTDMVDPGRYRDMPDDWVPWQVFAQNTYEHYRDHLPDLEAVRGRDAQRGK